MFFFQDQGGSTERLSVINYPVQPVSRPLPECRKRNNEYNIISMFCSFPDYDERWVMLCTWFLAKIQLTSKIFPSCWRHPFLFNSYWSNFQVTSAGCWCLHQFCGSLSKPTLCYSNRKCISQKALEFQMSELPLWHRVTQYKMSFSGLLKTVLSLFNENHQHSKD